MIDYVLILRTHFSGSEWNMNGDDYEGLEWLSDSPKPTKQQLDALWEETNLAFRIVKIREKRKSELMREADPLFFKWQRGEATEQEWRDAVESIRQKYPYPDGYTGE